MNLVIVSGQLIAEPLVRRTATSGPCWTLELRTVASEDGPRLDVTVVWTTSDVPSGWHTGTELAAIGSVRRRFFRVGGATQSRTEVEAAAVVEVTRRRPLPRAVERLAAVLGVDERAALRSVVG